LCYTARMSESTTFRRHGLTRTTKRLVFDALFEQQDGRCFICGISQAEIEATSQEHAIAWATMRKEHLAQEKSRSEGFVAFLAEHEAYAERYEKREGLVRNLSLEELAAWRQKNHAVHGILHIDHCHTTGAIRGLLCERCNEKLGHVENSGLLAHYSNPAYQYEPLNAEQEALSIWLQTWLEKQRASILLYMQPERWLPRKDILFHLASFQQNDEKCQSVEID